ncbi:uncharacterized protein PV09_03794 [Verruconis gallopava]|uniref:Nucleoporin NDC1 n=1 Tax=Verruconis gallopava TaxID=253628 RepID=A0A0D1YX16_9PEZI|nr:uncharacterized protein PV09_03794 [Verruconis gallopava]KIW05262.1 hypothetical protein PV09_03794 [Verruconis gallopava]
MATTAAKRPRPYREFLTPALHRQFTRAGGLTLAVCFGEAVYMGQWDLFWKWFPIGPAGARTLLLAISVLLVMIIRVSRLHVGRRTTISSFATFKSQFVAVNTYTTFAWYIVSALLFAEVYVWAQPSDSGFGVINHGRAHERARLNERAIAFRTLFVMLGILQSLIHLFSDRDMVPSPTRKVKIDPKAAATISVAESPIILIKAAMPGVIGRLAWISILFPVLGFLVYIATPLRSIAWHFAFDTLRFVFFLPAKQRFQQTGFTPIIPFFWAVVEQTALLVLLWEIANAAFSAYIAQPPLKNEQPLTSDNKKGKSVDPNGSLISGLKSKKEFAKASAFYELLLITIKFPERRKSIYSELDRAGGNSWTQISQLCLNQIIGITKRIDAFNNPTAPTPPPPIEIKERAPIAPPLKTDNIFAAQPLSMGTPARTGEWAKSVAAKYGNSPGAEPAKDIVKFASRKLLTNQQRQALAKQPQELEKRVENMWDAVLKSPIGWPFRQSFERKIAGVVCGVPHSQAGVIVDAIDALTRLTVESLKEDVYGQVANDVAGIIRTYMRTLNAIHEFVHTTPPHWSDVTFTAKQRDQVKDVNDVIDALTDGLSAILGAFGEYLPSMGLEGSEIKEIKALVAERQKKAAAVVSKEGNNKGTKEMEQVR